ncbi:transcriptional regulator [Halobacteriales archaeon SW_12_71_31]|nr:MAG: transcriptional regulator [Halobacteriales archaeon SW_12_71_31]
MTERLSTGVTELDRQFRDGAGTSKGLPAGSLIAVEAPPGSQVEPLVWSFMTERPSVYVPTVRAGDAVRDELDDVVPRAEYTVRDVGFDTPVRDCSDAIELVDREANVVLDPVTPLEDGGGDRYVKFLNGLQRHLSNVGGLGLLVAPTAEDGSRSRQHTLGVADIVWELRTDASAGSVETYLVVRKFRGGEVPDEPVSLDLGRRVRVDTSRDIA